MLVYRVDHPSIQGINPISNKAMNIGAYCNVVSGGYETVHNADYSNVDSNRHPHPEEDSDFKDLCAKDDLGQTRFVARSFYFGFGSLECLYSWFSDDDLNRLGEKGYQISIYEVEDDSVIIGNKQLAFHHEHCVEIDSIDLCLQ